MRCRLRGWPGRRLGGRLRGWLWGRRRRRRCDPRRRRLIRPDGVVGLRARTVDPKGRGHPSGVARLQPPEHLDVAMIDNRDVRDGALRRDRVDRRGRCLRGPDEILVGRHSRGAVNRHVRYAIQAVLRAVTAVNCEVDDLGRGSLRCVCRRRRCQHCCDAKSRNRGRSRQPLHCTPAFDVWRTQPDDQDCPQPARFLDEAPDVTTGSWRAPA